MGEVVVKVKLTNNQDIWQLKKGHINESDVKRLSLEALVDTGAIMSTIPEIHAEELGLEYYSTKNITLADGTSKTVNVTEPVLLNIGGLEAFEELLVLGPKMLIGQTALEKTDWLVDCAGRVLVGRHGDVEIIAIM